MSLNVMKLCFVNIVTLNFVFRKFELSTIPVFSNKERKKKESPFEDSFFNA